MYPNGVTHEVVEDDQSGMAAVLKWLSYVPATSAELSHALPHADLMDPVDRDITFSPTKSPYDPRHMLAGLTAEEGSHLSGFCDKGSFTEYLGGWGKSVVVGRGRLGGVNIGVIAVETRQVEQRIPADPGNAESRESLQPQAGQVWYPDSAHKTAQAIADFSRGENLPLVIFANWRGFSGGTRDMYGEILKYGAMIVDALRDYKQPVFIYIPPHCELRGGAWVVLDPTINIQKIQMFADEAARGGILEPPGICEVKYRPTEQVATMHRLDGALRELDEALPLADQSQQAALKASIKSRERALSQPYLTVAHEFADLHDRAGRMKAKGCIEEVLTWRTSRRFFYWRILKRQAEESLKEALVKASRGALSIEDAHDKVHAMLPKGMTDQEAVKWFQDNKKEMDALVAAHTR
jgi:acetyl-CoA carboxylase/biotin carboxylase 1